MTNVVPASQQEIDLFLQGAEERYAERGLKPKQAAALFDRAVIGIAGHLFGAPAPQPTPATPAVEKSAADSTVYGAAMNRMFELGVPKAKAEAVLAGFAQKQAHDRRIATGVNHLLGKLAMHEGMPHAGALMPGKMMPKKPKAGKAPPAKKPKAGAPVKYSAARIEKIAQQLKREIGKLQRTV